MVEKGDFVLLELEGRDQEGRVFDSTSGPIAKKLHGREGPLLVVYGMDKLIPGIFGALGKMKKGESRSIHLSPQEAFGERKKELIKIMSTGEFAKHEVAPKPGLLIHVDTDNGRLYGTVKSVTAGRVMVDFNHPIAGQEVDYSLKLIDVFDNSEQKISQLLSHLSLEGDFTLRDGVAEVRLKKKQGQEYEVGKAMLLVTMRSKIAGIKKVELKEQ